MSFHTKLCCVPSSSILLSLIKSLWSISVPSIVFLGTLPKTVYRNVCAQRCSNLFAFVYLKSGIQSLNSHFQHEFPSLQAAGDQEKTAKEQPDEAQGSAPSLRPQCMCSIYCFFFFIWLHCLFLTLLLPLKITSYLIPAGAERHIALTLQFYHCWWETVREFLFDSFCTRFLAIIGWIVCLELLKATLDLSVEIISIWTMMFAHNSIERFGHLPPQVQSDIQLCHNICTITLYTFVYESFVNLKLPPVLRF